MMNQQVMRAAMLLGAIVTLHVGEGHANCTVVDSTTWACGTTGVAGSLRTDLDNLHNASVPGVLKNGDTITVPAGTFDFSSELDMNTGKCFKLVGAGAGNTIIRTTASMAAVIRLQPSISCGLMEVTGFTFDSNGFGVDFVTVTGHTTQFRYHHNTCIVSQSRCIWSVYSISGVIDHNTITWPSTSTGGIPLFIYHCAYRQDVPDFSADQSRALPLNLGDADVMVIEDNTFTVSASGFNQAFAIDGWCGQRIVVRFNTFNNAVVTTHGEHDSTVKQGGNQQFEYYRNRFNFVSAGGYESFFDIRGGTGVIFGNKGFVTGVGTVTAVAYFKIIDREFNFYPWGPCDGTSPYDGNFGGGFPAGYPCYGQVGWHGGGLMNSKAAFPNDLANQPILVSSGVAQWPSQTLQPTYTWNNLINGVEDTVGVGANATGYIVSDREYYKYNASCVGGGACTSGTGQGTALPTSCTNGTGFFLTNAGSWNTSTTETYSDTPGADGLLYTCQGGVMTLSYTPLIYPHPLVTGGGGGGSPPMSQPKFAPGINLRKTELPDLHLVHQ